MEEGRFVLVQEPSDLWAIFDGLAEQPAELDGEALIGLTFEEATAKAAHLNDRFKNEVTVDDQRTFYSRYQA